MKYKFKIGDKVRVIKKGLSSLSRYYFGQIITIVEVGGYNSNGNYYSTDICKKDNRVGGVYEDEIKLAGITNPYNDIIIKEE